MTPDPKTEALARRIELALQRPVNLPPQPTPFVGRVKERIQLARLRADPAARLITLVAGDARPANLHSAYFLDLLEQRAGEMEAARAALDGIAIDAENVRQAWGWAIAHAGITAISSWPLSWWRRVCLSAAAWATTTASAAHS